MRFQEFHGFCGIFEQGRPGPGVLRHPDPPSASKYLYVYIRVRGRARARPPGFCVKTARGEEEEGGCMLFWILSPKNNSRSKPSYDDEKKLEHPDFQT